MEISYPLIRLSFYRRLIREINSFLRQPSYEPVAGMSTKLKVYQTIGLYVLKLTLLITVAIFWAILSPIYDPENISGSTMRERFDPLMLLLVGGFILPLVEEVNFRLSLRFKPVYLTLTTITLTYYLLTKGIYQTSMSLVDESFLLRCGVALLLGLISYPIYQHSKVRVLLSHLWKRDFQYFYYASCLIFAWIHIFNYDLTWVNILFMPLITLPQFLSAVINGYTRIAFGFQYPLLFHCTNNLIAISLSFLSFGD